MKRPTVALYYTVKESFWFLPTVLAAIAAGAATGSVELDRRLGDDWVSEFGFMWSGGAEGARSVLSVIAGSTMTVVSIVFSITITALAQTSSHFGPRVLRNFTRDRGNQVVLGTFVATFLFSLLVLRTVRSGEGSAFVPHLSVNLGLALAVLSLAVLIYFIHHIATSIQADLLVARIGDECREAVETMFPETLGEGTEGPAPQQLARSEAGDHVCSEHVGYVQAVDEKALFEAAGSAGVIVTVLARPGEFVSTGQRIARVAPAGVLDRSLAASVRDAFAVGDRRTPEQDLAYSVQQLVEIAGRALSPGVNEPFTAFLCIDHIGSALRSLAGRASLPPVRRDDTGVVRVIAYPLSFGEIVHLSLGMIRRHAGGASDVYIALLKVLRELAPALRREGDRAALLNEVRQIGRDAIAVSNPHDRDRVFELARQARDALRAARLRSPGPAADAAPAESAR